MKRSLLVMTALLSVVAMLVAIMAPFGRSAWAASPRAPQAAPSITIQSPRRGAVVTGNSVAIKGLSVNCAWAGKAPRNGTGHWHLLLDGGLVNMECSTTTALSMQNVSPGKHTLTALLAADDHAALKGKYTSATATFTYKPAHPLPALKAYKAPGRPSISILAPKNGTTVGEHFKVTLDWKNFRPSCALLGKPNVTGYGHWHLFVDTTKKGLATLLAMGCTHTATIFTAGLTKGKHTLYAVLADNLHAPVTPAAVASLTFNVKSGSTGSSGSSGSGGSGTTSSRWLSWNAAHHTATVTVIAGYSDALGGFNFNGYGDGKMTISVPAGTRVVVHFSNKSIVPHSAVITPWSDRTRTAGFPEAFKGSSSANATSGITAGTTQTFSFVVSKAGKYALVCGVPGHEAEGMWDVFTVTKGGKAAITF